MTDIEKVARAIWDQQRNHWGHYRDMVPDLCEWEELTQSKQRELLKEAAAAIAAMREGAEPVGWQPIETTPKDDAEYLVSNDRGQFVVWFDPDWTDGGWWMVSDGKDCERPLRGRTPTHWMPLPTPPAGGSDEQE